MKKLMKRYFFYLSIVFILVSVSGCWLLIGGIGAEAGYIVAQEDRTTTETLEDQRITSTVKTRLLADPDVSGLDINVDTFKSVVTLKGFVNSEKEAQEAIAIAKDTSGVKAVKAKLMVD